MPNSAIVLAIVNQRQRIAWASTVRKITLPRLGLSECVLNLLERMAAPISGANRTATNHDVTRAIDTTANSENVYSPASLWAKPIGTNPQIVTSVPVSIGNAVVLYA